MDEPRREAGVELNALAVIFCPGFTELCRACGVGSLYKGVLVSPGGPESVAPPPQCFPLLHLSFYSLLAMSSHDPIRKVRRWRSEQRLRCPLAGGQCSDNLVHSSPAYSHARLDSERGCFTDAVDHRALNGYYGVSASNTPGSCVSTCSSKGFKVAGVEYGRRFQSLSIVTAFLPVSSDRQVRNACARTTSGGVPGRARVRLPLAPSATLPVLGTRHSRAALVIVSWSTLTALRPSLSLGGKQPRTILLKIAFR